MDTPLCGLCRATLSGGGGLLAAGVNIVSRTLTGESPLQLSVTRGFIDVVESLLAAGANIETLDNEGATPLFWACDQGHLPVVERLLAAGANIDTPADDGETPLFTACRGGYTEVVKRLLAAGANTGVLLETQKPIEIATANGHLAVVKLFDKPLPQTVLTYQAARITNLQKVQEEAKRSYQAKRQRPPLPGIDELSASSLMSSSVDSNPKRQCTR